jgi:hypothetical protein
MLISQSLKVARTLRRLFASSAAACFFAAERGRKRFGPDLRQGVPIMTNARVCNLQRSTLARLLFIFAVVLAVAGCGDDRYAIPIAGTYPTAIDYWPAKKTLLVGTFDGAIYSMTQQGGQEKKLFDARGLDRPKIIRLRVDRIRDRLWVLGPYHVSVYDLATSRLLRHAGLQELSGRDRVSAFGDIELDEQGNAYVIDTGIYPIIYKADGVTLNVEAWGPQLPERRGTVTAATYAPLNALAITPDGAQLIYLNGYDGRLWSVDLRKGGVSEIKLSHPLYAASSMVVARDDAARSGEFKMYVTRASRNLISVVHLDSSSGAAKVRDLAVEDIDTPLSAVLVDGALFVTNSQLGKHPDFGRAGDVISPFQILYFGARYLAGHQNEPGPASTIVMFP